MTDWFRSWHGAPTDMKWRTIAKRAEVPPSLVVAVAWALMDRASQSDLRGSIEGLDVETLADFMGCETEEIERIVAAMRQKGVLAEDVFSAWDKRQPQREDGSAERAKAWREQKKIEKLIKEKDAEIARLKSEHKIGGDERSAPGEADFLPSSPSCERSRTQANAKVHRVEESREDITAAATRARERARLDRLEADLRTAAGLVNDPAPRLADLSPILGLIDAGFDVDEDILPVIRARPRKRTINSWSYFVGAIREARESRTAAGSERPYPRDGPPLRATRGVASALAGIERFYSKLEVG